MSTTVSYKGNTIATLNNQTKTLTTGGTWVESNITITDVSGVNCPVFTLNFDANNNITSVTCNKTFNECLTLADNSECAAIVQESHSGDIYTIYGISGYSDYDTELYILYSYIYIYTALNDILADIRYTASGIQIISPSETLGEVSTPTAAKGSVSNHSINVTPSVTYTGGWIDSGSKTGSAVTVSASELVSGNKAITSNGDNIDVTNYATVSVNVSSGGTAAISVVDTTDSHGGTVRTITGLDISDTTAVASDVASGKYFYTADGTKTQGTASGGGGSSSYTRTVIAPQQTVTPTSNGTYLAATLNTSAFESGAEYIITYNGTEYFYTCTVMWNTNYVLGDINYFYGNTEYPYPFGIIWMSGTTCTLACGDSTAVTVKIEKLELTGGGSSSQTITGTVAGDGTTTLEIPCSFEPDLVYIHADLSDDVSLRGVVSLTILKDIALYMTSDGSQSATQENLYTAIHGISNYNENNQNDEPYASYSNGTLIINTVENTSTCRFVSGVTYSYKLVGYSSVS